MKRQTHFTLGLESESIPLLNGEETIFSTLKLLSKKLHFEPMFECDVNWKEWVDSYGGKA